jgi:hypothetical protein
MIQRSYATKRLVRGCELSWRKALGHYVDMEICVAVKDVLKIGMSGVPHA